MSAAGRLRSAEGQMLACYFSRRPFDAARLGCGWARGMMPPVDQDAADDLVARYRQISSEISARPAAGLTPEDQLTCQLMREVIGDEIASAWARSFRSGLARYWLNTANPSRQPRYEMEARTHHESVPGHHIEMSRNQGAGIASPFRQLISILPCREGWATPGTGG
jgi:uncharacterized protein (DUF885 family)